MKALLLVDIQKGLTNKKGLYNDLLFFETVNFAVEKYRDFGYSIIFIQHNNKQLINGTTDWEIDSRINKMHTDHVLHKQYGNAFEKTELKLILENKNIQEILVCGLVSHGCVKSTCIGGLSEGFETNILANGHTNWNKDAEIKISSTESELSRLGVKIIDKQELFITSKYCENEFIEIDFGTFNFGIYCFIKL
jgi:nicotinamidase-related amidase